MSGTNRHFVPHTKEWIIWVRVGMGMMLLLLFRVPNAFLCRNGRNDFVCCTVHLRSKSCMQAAPGAFVGFVAPGEFFLGARRSRRFSVNAPAPCLNNGALILRQVLDCGSPLPLFASRMTILARSR